MKVLTIEQTRRIEAAADASGLSYARMMRNAGEAASRRLIEQTSVDRDATILFLIGKGNNGGDGLVMALDMAARCPAQLRLYIVGAREADDPLQTAAREAKLFMAVGSDDHELRLLRSLVRSADVIVDALFGIGARLPLRGLPARVLSAVKRGIDSAHPPQEREVIDPADTRDLPRGGRPYIFALDCPSGVDCDSGDADECALHADETICFIAPKRGLLDFPAAAHTGRLVVSDIGIDADMPSLSEIRANLTDAETAAALLPKRTVDGHKGSFGKALVVAGCGNYIGAVSLAAEGAYRAGAGLVTVATTRELVPVAAASLREPTWLPLPQVDGAIAESGADMTLDAARSVDALLIGPGLGRHASTAAFLRRLLESEQLPPLILDADALNMLSDMDSWRERLPPGTIITPHVGEMARLTKLSIDAIQADRWRIAGEYAAAWNLVVVLKGAHTLIASPSDEIAVSPFKCDALGTAGTGDVLAGLLAGLLAAGMAPYDCARLGVYAHALAGTLASKRVGSSRAVVAGDVLASLGAAFGRLEST